MSTTLQLLSQLEAILNMLENGENIEFIYLDFSKAYDRVDHAILIEKMCAWVLKERTLI